MKTDSLEKRVHHIRKQVYDDLFKTRGDKYKWFLRSIHSFRYFPGERLRGEFLETYYALMRMIDDIVDGDGPKKVPTKDRARYVKERIDFANNGSYPKDEADYLMKYCFELGDRLGIEFRDENDSILRSMLFDAGRVGSLKQFPRNVLDKHFFDLDVNGCVRGTLKIFGEDPSKFSLLAPLGIASRVYYNLRDFVDDTEKGFINIPKEDCQTFGITVEMLSRRDFSRVVPWMNLQAVYGLRLIEEAKLRSSSSGFSHFTRATLSAVYAMPSRRYFNKVLKGQITLS